MLNNIPIIFFLVMQLIINCFSVSTFSCKRFLYSFTSSRIVPPFYSQRSIRRSICNLFFVKWESAAQYHVGLEVVESDIVAKLWSKSFCIGVEAEIRDETKKEIVEPQKIDTGFYWKAFAVAALLTIAGWVVKFSAEKLWISVSV